MTFRFKPIDDYFSLFGDRKYRKQGNDFKALITKHFDECDSLIFCLIEKVTLEDKAAIGEKYLYSPFYDEKRNEEIIKRYDDIIKKVRAEFDLSLSQYRDWYSRNAYFLFKENGRTGSFDESSWRLDGKAQSEDRERTNYAYREEELEDETILKYLEFYAKQLHEDDCIRLKQYPHYAIIVRPISVKLKDGTIFPLGNLYLHFATKEEKSEQFYSRFLNDFLIVWMNKNGGILINEIKTQAKEEFNQRYRDYLPNLGDKNSKRLERKVPGGNSLYDLFKLFVDHEDHHNKFLVESEELKNELALIFLQKKEIYSSPKAKTLSDFNLYWRTGGKNGPKNIEEFKSMLLKRNIVSVGIFLFDYLAVEMHSLLKSGSIEVEKYEIETGRTYSYLWNNILLSIGKHGASIDHSNSKRLKELKESLYSSLSTNEKAFLAECYSYILGILDHQQKQKFDRLVFDQIKK